MERELVARLRPFENRGVNEVMMMMMTRVVLYFQLCLKTETI